jgi:hypothetical protein
MPKSFFDTRLNWSCVRCGCGTTSSNFFTVYECRHHLICVILQYNTVYKFIVVNLERKYLSIYLYIVETKQIIRNSV